MATGTFIINWTLQRGQCQVLTSPEHVSPELPSSPAIYTKDGSESRCNIDIHVPQDHQAVLISTAKACEMHRICEGQRQEYQGSCRAARYGTGMWQLTLPAQVSTWHSARACILSLACYIRGLSTEGQCLQTNPFYLSICWSRQRPGLCGLLCAPWRHQSS